MEPIIEIPRNNNNPTKNKSHDSVSSPPKLKGVEPARLIYGFFTNFGKNICSMPKLIQILKVPPADFQRVSPETYAEIFSSDSELKIKHFRSHRIESLKDYLYQINNENHNNEENDLSVYQNINFNTMKISIYNEIFIQATLYGYLETKINKYLYKSDSFTSFIEDKFSMKKRTVLIPDFPLFDKFFQLNEIKVEITSINDLLYENVSSTLTSLVNKKEKFAINLNDIVPHLDNLHMLRYLEYFNTIFTASKALSSDPLESLKLENFQKVLKTYLAPKKKENDAKQNEIIQKEEEHNNDNSFDNSELYIEIKTELEKKEKEFSDCIPPNPTITHLYFNTRTMNEQEIEKIVEFINKGFCKMFAWYLNLEATRKLGVKNVVNVGYISTLTNLNCYIINK